MRVDQDRAILARVLSPFAIVFASLCLLAAPAVFAQDEGDNEDEQTVEEEGRLDNIVVTGSRLKRDSYTSISPLQIITGQVSREVGLIDAADILQESTASGGQQIDLTFQGFVLDNGPGASTINLRGLGEARTLVLINGRRLAPSGVEGAPFAADLNQIPASLVQQYDLLLDGASSIYGSDAIAGVANVILRKDFDGFEIEAYTRVPQYSGGVDTTLSLVWGRNFDRGFVGIAAELTDTERVRIKDRPWTDGCDKHYEIDENGQFRTQEQFYNTVLDMEWDECRIGILASRVNVFHHSGSVYYEPGINNGGWGNFSEANSPFGAFGVDTDYDGVSDFSYRTHSLNDAPSHLESDLFPEVTSQKLMAYGEYTFDGEANITPYFETLYGKYDFFSNSAEGQYFPIVPANNPYNLCNPAAITGEGVDCGLAQDALYDNPGYRAGFAEYFITNFNCFGVPAAFCTPETFNLYWGPTGPQPTQPIVSVRGDRNFTDIEAEQLRVVGGVRGDMPFMNVGSLDNWSFDVYYSFSESEGTSLREGIREDRADLALGVYSTTDTPCENDTGAVLAADVAPGCVPLNLFASSLYPIGTVTGDFATQAERDYVFDGRDFLTKYEQSVISAYVTGDIFEVPAGDVAVVLGYEYRTDEIDSLPDDVANDGLLFGFFRDGGAVGEKDTKEFFAEFEVPLLAGRPAFEELTVNASFRRTDDERYGKNDTYSFKLGWRPVESLLIRATFGTAFRAPNLRELFLVTQTGFLPVFDPCLIPDAAINPLLGGYDPALDDREPQVLINCLANGVDPTVASNGPASNFRFTEIARRGSTTVGAPLLNAETSESWSAGFSWDQPFTNAFDLALSATYYQIDVENSIVEPHAQFAVNNCYFSLTGASIFCDYIERDFITDPGDPAISLVDLVFLNRNNETVRGVDINVAFDDTWTVFERPIDVGLDITANRTLERSTLFIDGEGNRDFDTFEGQWGFPSWNIRTGIRFDYDDLRFTWETRYLSSVQQNPLGVDDFEDAITGFSDTCVGPPTDVLCRDWGDTDNYFLHHTSVYYYGDRWTFGGGIRNVFNEKPPVVDGTEILSVNNTPIGYGYDINGRTYFGNISFNFGGGE